MPQKRRFFRRGLRRPVDEDNFFPQRFLTEARNIFFQLATRHKVLFFYLQASSHTNNPVRFTQTNLASVRVPTSSETDYRLL